MKKQDELRAQLARMKAEAEEKLKAGALEDAKAKVAEMDGIREQITLLDKLDADFADAVNTGMSGAKEAEKKPDAVARFADAARHGFKAATNLNETTGANGGYTVPEDIETQIRELRESADSLDRLVTVEQVTTLSGARTYKTRAQQTGMTKVAEGAALSQADGPSFTRVEYTVEKYGDLFYATNELLEDTDANIVGALIRWISGASRVGRNNLILSTINTALSAATELSDADGIKKAMNVTLDPAFWPYIRIVTNQDGFQYLDTLKDSDGRYLLTPMVQDPTRKLLFGHEVTVLSNATLPSTTSGSAATKKTIYPFYVGDFSQITLFVRKGLTVDSSNVAASAWENYLTSWRAIERLDCALVDSAAIVRGQITVDTPESTGGPSGG